MPLEFFDCRFIEKMCWPNAQLIRFNFLLIWEENILVSLRKKVFVRISSCEITNILTY